MAMASTQWTYLKVNHLVRFVKIMLCVWAAISCTRCKATTRKFRMEVQFSGATTKMHAWKAAQRRLQGLVLQVTRDLCVDLVSICFTRMLSRNAADVLRTTPP